jgi:uncharacterized membrane protein YiaA
MAVNRKDLGAGATFIGVALLYGGIALQTLPLGDTFNMGPGYFPTVLVVILFGLGAILVVRSGFAQVATPFFEKISWRAVVALSLSLLFFGIFVRPLGLPLAVFITSLGCAHAASPVNYRRAFAGAAILTVLCTGAFVYGLRVPIPIIGTWFGG